MPKKFLKRWTSDPKHIRGNPALSFLGALLHDPNLFHLNRHSVSVSFFAGLFIAFLPIPGQIPLAAIAALKLRCNLPITVLLVWVSNPLTFPFIFFFEYQIGASILMIEDNLFNFELSWQWFIDVFPKIWSPLMLGAIITSLFCSCAGYLGIQWYWRWRVSSRWLKRKKARELRR